MEIEFKNVSYVYNLNTPLRKLALEEINLKFKEGKINVIMGKSGSGKTTLAQLINALLKPTRGKIEIDDFVIERNLKMKNINDLRVNVGFVFQFPEEQIFNKTVKKEIVFGMKYLNYKKGSEDERAAMALKMVGLDESYLKRDPFTLSGGEMRRVAIASILAFNPKVIIFDEPTVGLDSLAKKNLIRLIKMLKNKYKKTIIIITHDSDMAYEISDYMYILQSGEIVIEGDKYKTFNHKLIEDYGIKLPRIIEFTQKARKKGIKLMQRDDINDLIKDVYRNVK